MAAKRKKKRASGDEGLYPPKEPEAGQPGVTFVAVAQVVPGAWSVIRAWEDERPHVSSVMPVRSKRSGTIQAKRIAAATGERFVRDNPGIFPPLYVGGRFVDTMDERIRAQEAERKRKEKKKGKEDNPIRLRGGRSGSPPKPAGQPPKGCIGPPDPIPFTSNAKMAQAVRECAGEELSDEAVGRLVYFVRRAHGLGSLERKAKKKARKKKKKKNPDASAILRRATRGT